MSNLAIFPIPACASTAAVVPASYIGLWSRRGIWRSSGVIDTESKVFWIQSNTWHIDSRGFAGLTVVEEQSIRQKASSDDSADHQPPQPPQQQPRCEWRPLIADPPVDPLAPPDAGLMRFEEEKNGQIVLHERAEDDSYREEWVRIRNESAGAENILAIKLQAKDQPHKIALLIVTNKWMAMAHAPTVTTSLSEASSSSFSPGISEFTFAEITATDSSSSTWRISLSSVQGREEKDAQLQLPSYHILTQLQIGQAITLPFTQPILNEWIVMEVAPLK